MRLNNCTAYMWCCCSYWLLIQVQSLLGEKFTLGYITGSQRRPGDMNYPRPGRAIPMAVEEINEKLLGPMGHSLDFVVAALWAANVSAFIGPQETCVHEGRMAAAFNLPMISYYCRDVASSNKRVYATFARTRPSDIDISRSVVAVLTHFNFMHITVVYLKAPNHDFSRLAYAIITAANEKKISIRTVQVYRQPYYYENRRENFTLYVSVGYYHDHIGLMLALDSLKLLDSVAPSPAPSYPAFAMEVNTRLQEPPFNFTNPLLALGGGKVRISPMFRSDFFQQDSTGVNTTSTNVACAEKGSIGGARSSQVSLSSNPDLDFRYSAIFTEVAFYRGRLLAVKRVRRHHIDITREIKKELKIMRDLQHDNVNGFVGACIEPPNVCALSEYCTRGSLKDILENEDIKLDNMFIASLVGDIIRGMIFIHESPLQYHGALRPSNCLVDARWVVKLADFGLREFRRGELPPPPLEALADSFDCVRECCAECWVEDPSSRPDFKAIRARLRPLRKGMKPNIFDNMIAMMEKYANNLEALVDERTDQLQEEKKKTESYDSVTIYFSDIVGFTAMSAESTPLQVVDFLNDLYTCFDSILENFDVYKVETIGDAYMERGIVSMKGKRDQVTYWLKGEEPAAAAARTRRRAIHKEVTPLSTEKKQRSSLKSRNWKNQVGRRDL
ncbi:unnamed protein product [Leptidea sinapis]|uniref:guanylate cyclase n=1 Tax=Leptidea sinapis TaxID=189913 RepID=A0A5E4R2T2_9NEOP|nr:unnamed protein product [Leptidea sinapis]